MASPAVADVDACGCAQGGAKGSDALARAERLLRGAVSICEGHLHPFLQATGTGTGTGADSSSSNSGNDVQLRIAQLVGACQGHAASGGGDSVGDLQAHVARLGGAHKLRGALLAAATAYNNLAVHLKLMHAGEPASALASGGHGDAAARRYAPEPLAEARRLYELVISVREPLLGPVHPDSVTAEYNLAELLRVLGDDGGALRIQEDIVKRLRPRS